MKSTKLCAAIILLCIVVPVTAGYMMPSEEVERVNFAIDSSSDITSTLASSNDGQYTYYSGLDNNMYRYSAGTFLANTYQPTTNVGNWPYYLGAGGILDYPFPVGTVNLDDHKPTGQSYYRSYVSYDDNYHFEAGGVLYDGIIIYKNGAVYGLDSSLPAVINISTIANSGGLEAVSETGGNNIYVEALSASQAESASSGLPLYNDPQSGVLVKEDQTGVGEDEEYYYWFNGRNNVGINIVIDLLPDDPAVGSSFNMTIGGSTVTYGINSSGYAYVSCDGEYKSLGSASNYPYVWLRIDTLEGLVRTYGISGYEFPNIPTIIAGDTVPLNISSIGAFTSIEMDSVDGDTLYYVQSTTSSIGESSVPTGAVIQPDTYTNIGTYWGISLPALKIPGTSIVLGEEDGESVTLDVENGMILAEPSIGLDEDVSVSSMMLLKIPDSEGSIIYTLQGVQLDLGFEVDYVQLIGIWDTNVYLSQISSGTYTGYEWLPGAFGLDMTGFCVVGLGMALLCLLAGVLYQRRTGEGMMLVVLVSGAIGAVYLTLMIS